MYSDDAMKNQSTTPTLPSNEIKLIKSSIYRANGTLARYTGNDKSGVPVFSAHGTEIVTFAFDKVTRDEVNEYMGRK